MAAPTGILLAAGQAQRFFGRKLSHPLPDGGRMGQRAAANLVAALPESLAVIQAGDDELGQDLRDAGCRLVINDQPDRGMGHSIAVGVGACPQAPGWLIALGDMPWIRPETIATVAAALSDGDADTIVRPVYQGRPGHPVGFGCAWREALLALDGDRGGRDLVDAHPNRLAPVAVTDAGILRDVDTPADFTTPPDLGY